MKPKLMGAHVSVGKGLGAAVRDAKTWGCTAVQVFTSSPRMWKGSPADPGKAADLAAAREETGIHTMVSHDTYLVNLCHTEPETATKSFDCLKSEIERCAAYGIPFVVSHMGATKERSVEEAAKIVAEAALRILAETPESVTLLMETTAGQGSSMHARFDEIARTLEAAGNPDRLAVCLDTCHIFAAGYDIRTEEGYQATFAEFDRLIGLDRLKVIHCNDSLKKLGSRVDRHAPLGEGEIGPIPFQFLANDERFENTPILLETPTEDEGHQKDLKKLWDWQQA
ncbi:deoxyribonuclease IV [bacterium]|nr:MAG: deoxyribonuclease IV [bacterium]